MPSIGDITTFLSVSLLGQTHVPQVDLSSKTIIITGGNTGLGFDAARHLCVKHILSHRCADS